MWIQKKLADQDPTVYHHATYVMFHGLVDMIVTCFHMQKIPSDDKSRKEGKSQESTVFNLEGAIGPLFYQMAPC